MDNSPKNYSIDLVRKSLYDYINSARNRKDLVADAILVQSYCATDGTTFDKLRGSKTVAENRKIVDREGKEKIEDRLHNRQPPEQVEESESGSYSRKVAGAENGSEQEEEGDAENEQKKQEEPSDGSEEGDGDSEDAASMDIQPDAKYARRALDKMAMDGAMEGTELSESNSSDPDWRPAGTKRQARRDKRDRREDRRIELVPGEDGDLKPNVPDAIIQSLEYREKMIKTARVVHERRNQLSNQHTNLEWLVNEYRLISSNEMWVFTVLENLSDTKTRMPMLQKLTIATNAPIVLDKYDKMTDYFNNEIERPRFSPEITIILNAFYSRFPHVKARFPEPPPQADMTAEQVLLRMLLLSLAVEQRPIQVTAGRDAASLQRSLRGMPLIGRVRMRAPVPGYPELMLNVDGLFTDPTCETVSDRMIRHYGSQITDEEMKFPVKRRRTGSTLTDALRENNVYNQHAVGAIVEFHRLHRLNTGVPNHLLGEDDLLNVSDQLVYNNFHLEITRENLLRFWLAAVFCKFVVMGKGVFPFLLNKISLDDRGYNVIVVLAKLCFYV